MSRLALAVGGVLLAPFVLLLGFVVVLGGAGGGATACGDPDAVTFDGDVAATILRIATATGASDRVLLATFETAIVESGMRNLDHGDRDSLGVFQQRPSMGWGTSTQLSDPAYAARAFLLGPRVAGAPAPNGESGAIARDRVHRGTAGQLAQAVQRSAFPERYDQVETQAEEAIQRASTNAAPDGQQVATSVGDSWDGYTNGRIPASALASIGPGHELRPDAAASWRALQQQAAADLGEPIGVTDSYRSYKSQVAVKAVKGDLAATPGRSNHGWGLALDLDTGGWNGAAMRWLQINAHRHGWHHPDWARIDGSKPEHWHWEYAEAASNRGHQCRDLVDEGLGLRGDGTVIPDAQVQRNSKRSG